MPLPGFEWRRLLTDPGGISPDEFPAVFLSDRLIIRKSVLSPLPALKLINERRKWVATARRSFGFREKVKLFWRVGKEQREMLRIERDNPKLETDPTCRIYDPISGLTLGRFELRETLLAGHDWRYWEIRDHRGTAIGRIDDPKTWPKLPCRILFGTSDSVTIDPVHTIARPTFAVRLSLGPRDFLPRALAITLAVLLIAVRKHGPHVPPGHPGPA